MHVCVRINRQPLFVFLTERNIKVWSPLVCFTSSPLLRLPPFHPLSNLSPPPYLLSPSIPGSTFLWPVLRGSHNATQKESGIKEASVDGVLWQGSAEALSYSYSLSATETQHIKQAFTRIVCAQSCRL